MLDQPINNLFTRSVCHNRITGQIIENKPVETEKVIQTSLGSIIMKHARVAPSIDQQVKNGNYRALSDRR